MSYFPARSVPEIVQNMKSYAAFSARVELGYSGRGTAGSTVTYTTASFVVPSLIGSSVTISVNSTTNILTNDLILIGTRAAILGTPASPGTGAGTVIFSGRYQQGYLGGEAIGNAGWHFVAPNGDFTTSTAAGYNVPNSTTNVTATISVADRSKIPASSYVFFSNYAGVYRVTGSTATTLTLTLVTFGDIPPGGTCIVDTTRSASGTAVAQFWPLGVVPKGYFFAPTLFRWTTLATSAGTGAGNISVGWIPNAYSAGLTTRLGEWITNAGITPGGSMSPNKSEEEAIKAVAQSRLVAASGAVFGLRLNASGASPSPTYTALASIEGILAPLV